MSADYDTLIVVMRTADRAPGSIRIGCIPKRCHVCGAGLLVSLATMKAAAGYEVQFICTQCVPRLEPRPVIVMPPTGAQLREVARTLGFRLPAGGGDA
jgi:hypothetical protein